MLDVDIHSRWFTTADGARLHAVEHVQFHCEAQSFTCIVGPSGCGKTTTLRAVLGLDTAYDGEIRLGGNTRVGAGAQGAAAPRIAAVFQEPRLLPWRSVEDNVHLALGRELRAGELDALFAELGLTEVRQFFPGELSLGLARRAALARAFAVEPDLLVLDEPFVSLDEATAVRLRRLLMSIWQARPVTALMVTHNVQEAVELADSILVFSARPGTVRERIDIDVPREQRHGAILQELLGRVARAQAAGRDEDAAS